MRSVAGDECSNGDTANEKKQYSACKPENKEPSLFSGVVSHRITCLPVYGSVPVGLASVKIIAQPVKESLRATAKNLKKSERMKMFLKVVLLKRNVPAEEKALPAGTFN